MSSWTVKLRIQEQIEPQPHSQCMFLKQLALSHVLMDELGSYKCHQSSSAKPSCSHHVPDAMNSRATLSISLCTYSATESSEFGGQLPGRWKKGNSFQPGLLPSSHDVEGNHRWAAKKGREEHDKGVRKTEALKEWSFVRWVFTLILALFLIKGWDSELGGLARRSEQFTCGSVSHNQLPVCWRGLVVPATQLPRGWLSSWCKKSAVARFETDTPVNMSTAGKVSNSLY